MRRKICASLLAIWCCLFTSPIAMHGQVDHGGTGIYLQYYRIWMAEWCEGDCTLEGPSTICCEVKVVTPN